MVSFTFLRNKPCCVVLNNRPIGSVGRPAKIAHRQCVPFWLEFLSVLAWLYLLVKVLTVYIAMRELYTYLCFGDLLLKCFGLVVFASKNKSVNYEGALYLLVFW